MNHMDGRSCNPIQVVKTDVYEDNSDMPGVWV